MLPQANPAFGSDTRLKQAAPRNSCQSKNDYQ